MWFSLIMKFVFDNKSSSPLKKGGLNQKLSFNNKIIKIDITAIIFKGGKKEKLNFSFEAKEAI